MVRPSKKDYYLNIAKEVARKGTCLRRIYGALIVKDDEIISTGYCGAPRGRPNCCDLETCERERLNIPSGERYEICRSVHAEQNAIISAGRARSLGGTMYLAGIDVKTGVPVTIEPCLLCKKMIINAGIKDVWIYPNLFCAVDLWKI